MTCWVHLYEPLSHLLSRGAPLWSQTTLHWVLFFFETGQPYISRFCVLDMHADMLTA